jgi:predicted O-methyltransferase YrrM
MKKPSLSWIQTGIPKYNGIQYKPAKGWWLKFLNINKHTPVKYLEIGVFYGLHLFEVASIFPNSELHAIDPWTDYEKYSEYKGKQPEIWYKFNKNLSICPDRNRIHVHRGLSDDVVPTFPDNSFDIIYVDGNHETEYVYRDACMSFQKLKSGGYIIFDDYDWPMTQKGILQFLEEYKDNIILHLNLYHQYIIQKL